MALERCIDLNADAGESFGRWHLGRDAELMRHLTSVSVACGFHAGDPQTMRRSVRLAKENGVALGAHPGLPDRLGFGRRHMEISDEDVVGYCAYQVGALIGIARLEDVAVEHVKLHGALYAMVAQRPRLAKRLARAVSRIDPALVIVLPAGPAAREAASELRVAKEAFVDLDYGENGVPIVQDEYPVLDPAQVAHRAVEAVSGVVHSVSGRELAVEADTICLHGDIANAVEVAAAIVERFEREGIRLTALRRVVPDRGLRQEEVSP